MARETGEHRTAEVELLRVLSAEGERIFSASRARELGPAAGFSDAYVRQALHYLEEAGWIVRLKQGLYAMGSGVPGATPVHEYEIAMALVKPAAISHWSAMSYYSLTDQIPHKVFVSTTTGASLPRAAKTRPGRVLEREGVPAHELERLAALPVTSCRKLDATGPLRGPRDRHWMIQENLPGGIAT